jgi:glutathione S-transferase
MKLYFFPQTRATRPRWMLEELGLSYEMVQVDLTKGEQKKPEYMKVHPLGVLPALDDNGFTLFESAAIVMYLADKYPEKGFAPALGTKERGEYYQWSFFAMTEAEPPTTTIFRQMRFVPEAERQLDLVEQSSKRFKFVASAVEERLKGRDYLVGNKFTAADIIMGGVLGVGSLFGLLNDHPGLQAYYKRLMERPAAKKAFGK